MHRQVNAIAGRLSLRAPQRQSLEILDRIAEIADLKGGTDTAAILEILRREYPSVQDFERDFPSLCFALATGVGKTRLMGAFIAYLHLAHGIDNFFVLAPNLTIYNKLIADFTPNTPKYVFKGIAEFAVQGPEIITGDTYEGRLLAHLTRCKINIFNISKINSEVRGGRSPKIRKLSEYLGESYFDYLAALPDLVLLMDESHRYRASAGIRAINELKPILGLELTATPYVEASRGAVPFKNVIYDYPLSAAMVDGFVKEPAVVTRKDFNPAGMTPGEIERLKLEDGVRLHESVKVELETYAREQGVAIVKPFVLVIARDTTHAGELLALVESESFFDGRYAGKAIQVDSSRTGAEEEAMIARLLAVEETTEPTEIVIHVNMLKEGWDVTNLYTIVPLRAANARVLIEQSIGRGLRLPYGKRTGVTAVDRLNIVAHDRFQEILDEANRSDSAIRMQAVVIDGEQLERKTETVVSRSNLASALGLHPAHETETTTVTGRDGAVAAWSNGAAVFATPEDRQVAQSAYRIIQTLENRPEMVPTVEYLRRPEIQAKIVKEVEAARPIGQLALTGVKSEPDVAAIVAQTVELVTRQTIDIPRILVVPKGEATSGFRPFTLDLSGMNYAPVSDELWIQHLRTGQRDIVAPGLGGVDEQRLEDYVVSGLIDFDDISYDDHAVLLYDLARQAVEHLTDYLTEEDTRRVLRYSQRDIARLIHSQMQAHYWEKASGYEVEIRKGFTELRPSAYTQAVRETPRAYTVEPNDKSNMAKYVFGGFSRCLYPLQKFESDPERRLAVILERDAFKWFRPARGQFQIYYREGADHLEYQPDFVAEDADGIYMLEVKATNQLTDLIVLAKRDTAVLWCARATAHALEYGGKPWRYALIPHNAIADNMTLEGLVKRYGVRD